jgi:hypothetical protein
VSEIVQQDLGGVRTCRANDGSCQPDTLRSALQGQAFCVSEIVQQDLGAECVIVCNHCIRKGDLVKNKSVGDE